MILFVFYLFQVYNVFGGYFTVEEEVLDAAMETLPVRHSGPLVVGVGEGSHVMAS